MILNPIQFCSLVQSILVSADVPVGLGRTEDAFVPPRTTEVLKVYLYLHRQLKRQTLTSYDSDLLHKRAIFRNLAMSRQAGSWLPVSPPLEQAEADPTFAHHHGILSAIRLYQPAFGSDPEPDLRTSKGRQRKVSTYLFGRF